MTQSLIQQARDIAADQYIRLEMKEPTPRQTARFWADHIQTYSTFIRGGVYDNLPSVQVALAALRSVAP